MGRLASIVAFSILCFAAAPSTAQVSSDHPVGWRNDGSGQFPGATPPTTWSRVNKTMEGMRSQAAKPGNGPSGESMSDGVIREWLVLGPVPGYTEDKAILQDTIPGESKLSPAAAGQTTAGLKWELVKADNAWLNFPQIFGKQKECFVYAHSYIYSDTGGDYEINQTYFDKKVSPTRMWFNDQEIKPSLSRDFVRLNKGWNHILLKVGATDQPDHWYADLVFYGAHLDGKYDQSNIAWHSILPSDKDNGNGIGGPIVVGDKIFLQIESNELACLRKSDGKVLWIRPNTYTDAATPQEIQADPALQQAAEITKKLRVVDDALAANVDGPRVEEKSKLDKELFDTLKKAADKKFRPPNVGDVGYAGFTPTSDGKHVWAWFGSGLMTCYDLEGNRQWIKLENHVQLEHGFATSPLLLDSKVMMYMREFMAFDAKTGQIAWRLANTDSDAVNYQTGFYGSFAAANLGGTPVFVDANCDIIRATDGKMLFNDPKLIRPQQIPSPVICNGVFYEMSVYAQTLYEVSLPARGAPTVRSGKIPLDGFPDYYLPWHTASPVVYDGLVYLYNNAGVLTVVDAATLKILYQKLLDVDHFQFVNEGSARGIGVSPIVAGGHIYFFGTAGSCVVIDPGRTYKQIAKNKIENIFKGMWSERQERTVSNPFCDSNRIYWRGESGLWCMEGK